MAQQFVTSHLRPDKVVVFGKPTCPYCHKAMDLLKELALKAEHLEYVDITTRNDMDQIQDYFQQTTGAKTVPRVYIGDTCIGGFTDLQALKQSGELETVLMKIGAM